MRYIHFSKNERLELSILRKKGYSLRAIALALKRSPSSVSREVNNNGSRREYNPQYAQQYSRVRRQNAKYQGMKVRAHPELEQYIIEKMRCGWSPDVIAGTWSPSRGAVTITAKGIYKYLYSSHGQYLCRYLASRQYGRRKRKGKIGKKTLIPKRIGIEQRPQIIADRGRFGDFEGDTLGVPKYTRATIAAVVERKSRYILAQKIPRLKYAMDGFQNLLALLPIRSLTLDNGVENVKYQKLDIPTYFCHPYSSWEKGQIENVFGMIRRYIPKKASLANYSPEDISAIVNHINSIPRKILNYRSPKEVFEEQFLKRRCCTSG